MEFKSLTPDQLALIAKPLPKEAVKPHPSKPYLSTIKPIYMTERLNEVFGVGGWHIKTDLLPVNGAGDFFREVTTGREGKTRTEFFAIAKTTLSVPDYGIWHECVAGASNDDMGDAAKGATTDAISKICSWIGIGIAVYKGQQEVALRDHERQQTVVKPLQPAPDLGDWGTLIDEVRDEEGANDLLSRILKDYPKPEEGKHIKGALNRKCATLRLRYSDKEKGFISAAA